MSKHITLDCTTRDEQKHTKIVQSQREYVREIADVLDRGESLDTLDDPALAGEVAAAILRAWADNVPDKPKRKRGRPAHKLNPFNVAIEHELLKSRKGMSANAASETLAEKHDVSVEAIRSAIKKKGADARAFLEFFGMSENLPE